MTENHVDRWHVTKSNHMKILEDHIDRLHMIDQQMENHINR